MSPRTFIVLVPAFQESFVAVPAPFTTTSRGELPASPVPTAVLRSELKERLAWFSDRPRLSDSP